ncbi:hypothetical protein B7P43_G14285, partial [Cryptotermes secundus]
RVTVMASDDLLVYDRLVKPESEIIGYNTRFSGITARDLSENATKSLRDVQNQIRVTVVASDGHLVYDRLVKPESDIIEYNTRFSGITVHDLSENATKSLWDVQNDLMGFINADTILVGHGLENDLLALRITHGSGVDTSVIFPHSNGLPYPRSLKSLGSEFLEREIQQDQFGHCSFEDARACMEVIVMEARKDFDYIFQSGVQNFLQLQNKFACI